VTREAFAEAVRGDPLDLGLTCALIAAEAEPGVDVGATVHQLDALAALTRPLTRSQSPDPAGVAEALRLALGVQSGFSGFPEDYDDLRASLLPHVLQRHRGLPILLAVVWVEVARRLDVPAFPLALPGEVIVGVGEPASGYVLVDPFRAGRTLSVHDVAERVRAAGGQFSRDLLTPTPPDLLLLRVLSNIRVLAARRRDARTRLWAVEMSLLLPRHPAALRRERGELLVSLGDLRGGARELDSYADAIADAEPAAAEVARGHARMARARLN
jgi:regulator of sirC expression with transglutaminase-like and TPR domain